MALLQNLYNKAKSALTDNEGWFRQGKFTPVTQMTGKSLSSQINPPLISPIVRTPQEEASINWNTPETYQNQQPQVIAPPKPSFKTQAAEKLNSRLDQIKRFGSSVMANSMDDNGIVRKGQFTPFAPIDDAIKATPVMQTVQKAVAKRVQGVKDFGEGIGKSFTTNWDTDRIMKAQQAESERTAKTFETVRKLRSMGKNDEADFLVKSVYEHGNDSDINQRIDDLNNEINGGQKKLISGAIKTAEIPLAMAGGKLLPGKGIIGRTFANPIPVLAGNMTIGSLLSGGMSKLAGETPEQQIEASATGMDDAFGYTGITSLITNPIIEKVLGASKVKNILINQILQRTLGGLGNVGEDKLLAGLDEKDYTMDDAKSSFVVGGAITGNDAIAKGGKKLIDKYVFGKEPVKQVTEKASKFFGNQYVKIANKYNKTIDNIIGNNKMEKVGGGTFTPTKWIKDAQGNDKLVKINPQNGEVLMGGFAGLEPYQDEQGNWQVRFNPELAGAGMMVSAGLKTKVGKEALSKLKLPEIKGEIPKEVVPDGITNFKPAGWKPESTVKSISDIFANRKNDIGVGTGYKVKGVPIQFEKLMSEGWKPEQIDYAVKLANDAKVTPKNAEAYVRGILKAQYPNQASKMGRNAIPLPPEPPKSELDQINAKYEDPELKMERMAGASKTQTDVRTADEAIADMESKMKQLEEAGYNPNPNIKPESNLDQMAESADVARTIETPKKKSIKEVFTDSELVKQNQAKKAELDYADKKRKEIVAMMKAEGFDTKVSTAEKIMAGELPASPELKSALEKHSTALGGETVKYKNLPEDKLKENYVPHVKKSSITPVDTESDGFVGMMNRNTFDPTKKRNNLINDEDMANVDEAFRQEHISVLNEKYYASEQANKIIKENNLPPEKADEVLKFIEKEKEIADKVAKEHIEATDFGVKHDYLADAKRHDDELSAITGTKVERPVVEPTHKNWVVNSVDNLQSLIRGDAMFFKAKTNKEINDAFLEFRLSQTGETKQRYDVALNKFINKLTKYDYADPAVRERVNQFIDDKLKENKVIQGLSDKVLRGASEVFSMAQIGGNIKTVITQPTETFRLIPEHGLKSFIKGVTGSFNPTEAKRLMTEYGLEKEISGNLAQNPLYKEVSEDPAFKDKVYDSFKNILFKGLEVTENWKNVAYASALEDAGKKKGLSGELLKKFVMQEMLRLAHMADTDMTPRIMKNSGLAGSLLQYSQYLLKNEVLKWDTITAKDTKTAEKMKKIMGLFLADFAAIGTVSAVTGVGVDGVKGWLSNSGLPNNFGPILTVPYQMAKDAYDFAQLTPEEQEKQTSLMDREKATIFRNFVPMGNQISKTKNALEVMDKGYAESKKGNVNYAVGDMNVKEKVQATLFGTGAIPAKKEADQRWDKLSKDGIYPTLTSEQSAVLKSLPKEEQKAYYDKQMEGQVSNKKKLEKAINPEKPNLINSIFGKKEKAPAKSISSILTSETATQADKAKAKSEIKAFIDAGRSDLKSDEDMKAYFFNEVEKMPESTPSEKQAKTIAKFKKLDSIYDSETLDEDTKDRLIKLSGVSKEDITYYNNAKDDATVKAMRQEELAGQISRDQWMSQLEDGRKLVGNKQIVDNATLNELYERGFLTDAERDYLVAVKYDPATSQYYVDRDYRKKQSDASASARDKQAKKLDALKKELKSGADKPRTMSRKAIVDYLNNKPTKSKSVTKTIGSILSAKNITPTPSSAVKVNNRVKSQYKFTK